jgi:hypothetical protein
MKKINSISCFIIAFTFLQLNCTFHTSNTIIINELDNILKLKSVERTYNAYHNFDTLVVNINDTSSYVSKRYNYILSEFILLSLDSLYGTFNVLQVNHNSINDSLNMSVNFTKEFALAYKQKLARPEGFKYLLYLRQLFDTCPPDYYDYLVYVHSANTKALEGYSNVEPIEIILFDYLLEDLSNLNTSNLLYRELYMVAFIANRGPDPKVTKLLNIAFRLKNMPIVSVGGIDSIEAPFIPKPGYEEYFLRGFIEQ